MHLAVEVRAQSRERCSGQSRQARRRFDRGLGKELDRQLIDERAEAVRWSFDIHSRELLSIGYAQQRRIEHQVVRGPYDITEKHTPSRELLRELERRRAREIRA